MISSISITLPHSSASKVSQLKTIGQQSGIDAHVLQDLELVLTQQVQPILTLALVGAHGHGKSTLANALAGQQLLPINAPFEQTTLYRLSHSDLRRTQLISTGMEAPESVEVEQLATWLQRKTNLTGRAIAASIKEIRIDHPVPDLKKGVVLLDTPGIGSESIINQLTLTSLTEADVVLYVLMPDQMFRDYLARQLRQVLEQDNVRLFFVMTGMDRFADMEMRNDFVQETTYFVQQVVRQAAGERFGVGTSEYAAFIQQLGPTSIFLLSGHYGLEAKLHRDSDLLAQSGLSSLEDQLDIWLAEKRLLHSQQREEINRQIFNKVYLTVTEHIKKHILHLEHEQLRMDEGVRQIQSLVYALQQMGEIEVNRIDTAAKIAAEALSKHLSQYHEILEKNALEFIERLFLGPEDFTVARYQFTWSRILFRLACLWQETVTRFTQQLQVEILQAVNMESNRLHGFATTLDQLMSYAEQKIQQMGISGLPSSGWAIFTEASDVRVEQERVVDEREKKRFAHPVSRWVNLLRTTEQSNVSENRDIEMTDDSITALRQRLASATPTVHMFGHKWLGHYEVAQSYSFRGTIDNPRIAYHTGMLSSTLGYIKLEKSLLQLAPPESPPLNLSAYKQSLRLAIRACLNKELIAEDASFKPLFEHLVRQNFSNLQLDILNVAEKAQMWLDQLRKENLYQEQLQAFRNLREQLALISA